MNKFLKIGLLMLFIGCLFLSGCIQESSENEGEEPTRTITLSLDEAYQKLMDTSIKPDASMDQLSGFMLSEVLEPGDEIISDSGETYNIDNYTWFVFIDDAPDTFFAHPTRYVLINAETGKVTTINENWPPLINNESLWDETDHNRGYVIDIYPILNKSKPITDLHSSSAPSADYGDAPDTQDAYQGIIGTFPTFYNTSNSRVGYHGGHTLHVGEETIGMSVSSEKDVDDVHDPDLVPNLIDADKDDRLFVKLNKTIAQLSFTVEVDKDAPDVIRYVNVLVDFDQNGSWMEGRYGKEWMVVNYEINVSPGSSKTITTPAFSWGNRNDLPSPVWMRLSLTRKKVNETLFSTVGGWDGSGQFSYGEIEDHLVYLTDVSSEPEEEWPPWPENPPTGKDPDPPEPPEPQPPGPTNGPCGTDVNYYSIIINGGDSSSHIGKGMHPADQAVDSMTDLLGNQGYNSIGTVSPGGNSLSDISIVFENLKNQVNCGDHVLIYIVGHGKPASKGGGVTLRGSNGKTHDTMKPSDLAGLLNSIPACPDEDCDTKGKCCHVTVVIESCYAGNFNVPGVTGEGRTVMGSCDDEPADASDGGIFTSGFNDASNSENSDTNDDDMVSPNEAFGQASNEVDENNGQTGRSQEPWIDSQECECKCPCSPSIDVDKWVWDNEWTTGAEVSLESTVSYRIEIENDGKCRNVSELSLVDTLDSCLDYGNDATVQFINTEGQETELGIIPSYSDVSGGGLELIWNLGSSINLFAPGEKIIIDYTATTLELGDNDNIASGSARCTYDSSIIVTDADTVTVTVVEEPEDQLPPVEEVMNVFLEGDATSTSEEGVCSSLISITSFGAEDLTGGDYPITNVILKIDGVEKFNSGSISTTLFDTSYEMMGGCSTVYSVSVIATNSLGQQATYNGTITTPGQPVEVMLGTIQEEAITVYSEESCSSTVKVWYNVTDLTGGDMLVTHVTFKINDEIIEDVSVSQIEYLGYYEFSSACGVTYDFELIAMNANDQTLVVTSSITTPLPP